jgi:pyruvate/2-oxoglutarate dehydrogenase complex dihydrolipoamide dehydrogenase (E3) component
MDPTAPHGAPAGTDRRAEHLEAWTAQVAPADWANPVPAGRYNLVVIGAGPAGLVCAAGAAGLGARVALVERHRLGGDCLNVGCVPSKGLIRAARAAAEARDAGRFGVDAGTVNVDFRRVMERMYRVRTELAHHDSARRFTDLGVDVFLGEGRFAGPDRVTVGDAELRFARAVIATGARAALPDVPGLLDVAPLTNETVFDLPALPGRLAVIGSGPIGLELGQAFARLGSRVTLIEQADRILGREEDKAAAIVHAALERDGVRIVTGARVTGAKLRGGDKVLNLQGNGGGEEVAADAVLVGAGRLPNVESLDLEAAGVDYRPGEGVRVDERLRTANPRVFAAGDVCFPHKFTHAADACARLVIANALFKGRQKATNLVVPWCTFTQPEVAHVGFTEREAREDARNGDVDVIEVETRTNDRSRLDADDTGYARVYLKKGTDRILGATVVADHAGDLIGEMALAITRGIGLKAVAATIHPYPTHGEIWKKVADAYNRGRLTPTVQTWMRRWMAFTR